MMPRCSPQQPARHSSPLHAFIFIEAVACLKTSARAGTAPLGEGYLQPYPMADDNGFASEVAESDKGSDDASELVRVEDAAPNPHVGGDQTPPTTGGAVVAAETSPPKKAAPRKRKPPIDIDTHIAAARQAMKEAQKQVAAARSQARNERRKKQRLVKKAATLTAEDLERIAVLKRCGVDPARNVANASGAGVTSIASSASGSSTPATSPALGPASSAPAADGTVSTAPRPPSAAAA